MTRILLMIIKTLDMKTHETMIVKDILVITQKNSGNWKFVLTPLLIFSILVFSTSVALAHCDTMDGPLIADARKSIAHNNINYVLKWVPVANESEVGEAFNLMMKVRGLSPEAKELSEKYFFETLVRIHRVSEGVPYTGLKPSGTPVDERVLAADQSIENGNLSPLKGLVQDEDFPELTERFNKALSLKNFNVNNVEAGREYIEAYVKFFKFAEGETDSHAVEGHAVESH
jgi:Family of unknown function (DUF6448)